MVYFLDKKPGVLVYFLDKKPGERPLKSDCLVMNSFSFHTILYICIYISTYLEEERDAVGQRKIHKENFNTTADSLTVSGLPGLIRKFYVCKTLCIMYYVP